MKTNSVYGNELSELNENSCINETVIVDKIDRISTDEIPRRNLLYPKCIETPDTKYKADHQKIEKLKEKLFSKPTIENLTQRGGCHDSSINKILEIFSINETFKIDQNNSIALSLNASVQQVPEKIKRIENLLQFKEKETLKEEKINSNAKEQNILENNTKTSAKIPPINAKELILSKSTPLTNSDPISQNKYKLMNNSQIKGNIFYNIPMEERHPILVSKSLVIPESKSNIRASTDINSKINITGDLINKKRTYIPSHHKDLLIKEDNNINLFDSKQVYQQSDIIGKVDEEVINYFQSFPSKKVTKNNNSSVTATTGKNLFKIDHENDFDILIEKQTVNKTNQIKIVEEAPKGTKLIIQSVNNSEIIFQNNNNNEKKCLDKEEKKKHEQLEKLRIMQSGFLENWE